MRAKIGNSPIEADELNILGNVRNSLFLLSQETTLPRPISAQLIGMHWALDKILEAHGKEWVGTCVKKDGTMDEWPDSVVEAWEAIK